MLQRGLNLDNSILSERLSQKTTYHIIPFKEMSGMGKSIKTDIELVDAGG